MTSLDRGWHYPSSEYYCLDVTKQCGWKDLDDRLWVRRRHSTAMAEISKIVRNLLLCFVLVDRAGSMHYYYTSSTRRGGSERSRRAAVRICDMVIWNGTVCVAERSLDQQERNTTERRGHDRHVRPCILRFEHARTHYSFLDFGSIREARNSVSCYRRAHIISTLWFDGVRKNSEHHRPSRRSVAGLIWKSLSIGGQGVPVFRLLTRAQAQGLGCKFMTGLPRRP
jgi:hypothetical protein